MLRYGLAGGLITVFVALSYWVLAEFGRVDPMISLAVVFVIFSFVSYGIHGAFSFRGYGARDRGQVRMARFMTVNIIGFLANQFFVWLLVKQMGGATWWPTIPIILVTPLLTFSLHRRWVFA
ncbi:MAG: GtrA family protein [Sphingomicrobium sp.]